MQTCESDRTQFTRRSNSTTAMVYVQVGQQTIADYVAGSVTSSPIYRYVYASYIDEPVIRYEPSATETLYYHRGQQYSITALTDSGGNIVERYAYSAYGVPTITNATGTLRGTSSYDNRYTYTGREWDNALFMYHYRARMYDAELGRFLSRDPIGFSGSKWLLYTLLSNSPLVKVDPKGLFSLSGRQASQALNCLRSKVEGYYPISRNDFPGNSDCNKKVLSGALEHMVIRGTLGELGVGLIMAGIGPLLPEGIAGQLTEALIESIIDTVVNNPTMTIEDLRDLVLDQLIDAVGDSVELDDAELAMLGHAADLIVDMIRNANGRSCVTTTIDERGVFGETFNCSFTVCGSPSNAGVDVTVTGMCRYTCIKRPPHQMCCCGISRTVIITGVSGTIGSENSGGCRNFNEGSSVGW